MVASSAFAAVLLSDIVSSTQLRIRLGAAFTRLLREHDELVTSVLDRHGALTREDTGDGFLATFDSTTAALQAACALQWAVVERNASVAPDQRFQIRVVLAAGELYGRPEKRSGLALVDVARLENATEADDVRCTDVFRLLAGEQAPGLFTGAEDVAFQGLDEPRRVWQVDWRAAPPFPSELPLPAPLAGSSDELFVGREAELAQLERIWSTVAHSGHRLVLVRGGAGMGKSTLARRFARDIYAQHGWVLYGRCDPDPRTPFQPFAEALATFVADTGRSRQLLGRFPDRLARLLPGPEPAVDAPAASGDQEADRFELFEAVADWLALISFRDPVLLVIDDLNWADRATLDLLRHVVRSAHLGSVCILATYRTVEEDQSAAFRVGLPELQHLDREIEVLTLAGLSDDQVRRAVAHRLGDPAAAGLGTFAQDLRAYTSGNPLFVGAILGELSPEVLAGLRDGSLRPGAAGRPRRPLRRARAVPGSLRSARPAGAAPPRRGLPHGFDVRPGGRRRGGGLAGRGGRRGGGPAGESGVPAAQAGFRAGVLPCGDPGGGVAPRGVAPRRGSRHPAARPARGRRPSHRGNPRPRRWRRPS